VTSATRLVVLLSIGVFINYVDRGNLATAAPVIQDELHLSARELGVLLSAFYYGYVATMVPVGWLAERYGAKVMLGAGALVWSAATLMTGFASTFTALLLLRLLLGIGESAAFPCASKLLAQSFGVARLGIANGVLSFGYLLGPAVGTLIGGLLLARFGWRAVFILFGACSLAWLLPWRRVVVAPATRCASGIRSRAFEPSCGNARYGARPWVCSQATMGSISYSPGCRSTWSGPAGFRSTRWRGRLPGPIC